MTQATVSPRILGKSESVLVPNRFLITATGNNIVLAGDLNRRSLLCRLDPRCERPELREFDFEPVRSAMELRPQLVTAALTILRAFKLCGKPSGRPALGSFEQWSAIIRDAMFWVGMEDPTGTIETIHASDPELRALTSVMTEWKKKIGMDRVTVASVIAHAIEAKTCAKPFSASRATVARSTARAWAGGSAATPAA